MLLSGVKEKHWKVPLFFFFFLACVLLLFASDIKCATVESVLGQRPSHEWSVSLVKTGDE